MTMMMESRGSGGGGCCVARYDAQKVDRIMLRFRPIAPKPTAGGSLSGGSSPESNSNGDTYAKIGRGKRRYKSNTINNNNNSNAQKNSCKRRKASPEVVTLSLLPEAPEKSSKRSAPNAPIWLNFNSGTAEKDDDVIGANSHRPIYYTPDRTVIVVPHVVGGTCVTLECLTYTMVGADALGRTDKERVMNLVRDTCPGFVSDGLSRVTWSNEAFKEMVGHDQADYRAWVAMKESVPAGARAFSCRVKILVENNKQGKTMTVPCDVWRMDSGGFAWRLDVKAALTLAL